MQNHLKVIYIAEISCETVKYQTVKMKYIFILNAE